MEAKLRISTDSPAEAEVLRRAISVDEKPGDRSSESASSQDCQLTIDIKARDLGALRASLNSSLRQIKIASSALL